jgi:hypothetical protein
VPSQPYCPPRPCEQKRGYRHGINRQLLWVAKDAQDAVIKACQYWIKIGAWEEAEYETVTVVNTGEIVKVRTTYLTKDGKRKMIAKLEDAYDT